MYKILIILLSIVLGFIMLYKYDRFNYGFNDNLIKSPEDATLDNKKFYGGYSISGVNKGLSSSLSFWIYIDDWNYRYMQKKFIFDKGGFVGYLSPATADLVIEMPILMHQASETLTYNNITLQKWTHVCIIVENRNIDLWINGELHLSKYLKNIPLIAEKEPLKITPGGGFKGLISNINVWETTIGKKVVQHMYNEGPIYQSYFSNYKEQEVDVPVCPVVKPGSEKKDKSVTEGFATNNSKKKKAGEEKEENNELINEAINIKIQNQIDRRNRIKNMENIRDAKERDRQHKLELQRKKLKNKFPYGQLIFHHDTDKDNQISYNELYDKYPEYKNEIGSSLNELNLDTNDDKRLSYSELNNAQDKSFGLSRELLSAYGEKLPDNERRKYFTELEQNQMLWTRKKYIDDHFKGQPKDDPHVKTYKFLERKVSGYDKTYYNLSKITEDLITNKSFYTLFNKYKSNKKSKTMRYSDVISYINGMHMIFEDIKNYPKLARHISFLNQPTPNKYTIKTIAKMSVVFMLFINGKEL